jgi:hypothetical protein
MRLSAFAFTVVAIVASVSAPAIAADQVGDTGQQSVREACAADFTKFCAGQDARSEAGRSCMRTHHSEFSQTCQSAMSARRAERMDRIKSACSADIAKFCNSSSQTDGRPGHCLREHKDELSESCKAAFPHHQS